ncbi:helix-turn-helix transcriptional regulator [Paenibacillus harenae]|uniref:helix-turn-helix transcriptional regulator n=1 Tax=Paenibacillus harenae TaxID=306543 RepID=UPI0003FDFA70|nr:YafY family protein [Paenibacillus harenae]
MNLERLMAITILLLNRKRVQAQDLADRLEVSLRTIYRDLDRLNMAGIPIVSYTGGEGGFEIMESFRLDRQMLSMDDLTALTTALRGLQSSKAYNGGKLDVLLEKVGALVSKAEGKGLIKTESVMIDLHPWRKSHAEKLKYDALSKAVDESKVIFFTYTNMQGNETERRVEPMGLVLKGYTWYLYGFCLQRNDFRNFRLSRIRGLTVLHDKFERREVSLSELNERWGPKRNDNMIDLVLKFNGAARVQVEDHFDESEIERQSDGSFIVRVHYPENDWLIGFLLSFRTGVCVLEPTRIASAVKKAAIEISEMYRDC